MNEFFAKVKTNDENAGELIRAFFQEFNPESSIAVKENEAKLKIIFEQPPVDIISAISDCADIELHYGKSMEDYKEELNTESNSE